MSQAADLVIGALPAIPSSSIMPYTGAQVTAAARASLQQALDDYKTGHVSLPTQSAVNLDRSDTRSFGESHANELSSIDVPPSAVSHSPSHSTDALPAQQPAQSTSDKPGTSTDIAVQNQPAAPVPEASVQSTMAAAPAEALTAPETNNPASTGPDGSGPASKSVLDPPGTAPDATSKAGDSTSVAVAAVPAFPSAEEEKKKLKETYSQEGARPATGPEVAAQEQRESAEEEKKRLEREERERLLAAGGSNVEGGNDKNDEELPPYQELS